MDSIYLETTIVGHIAGRIHPDPFVAARQQITRDWWHDEAPGYQLFIKVCRDAGYEPPVICTPEELVGIDNDP
jgi:hypothetical protein